MEAPSATEPGHQRPEGALPRLSTYKGTLQALGVVLGFEDFFYRVCRV